MNRTITTAAVAALLATYAAAEPPRLLSLEETGAEAPKQTLPIPPEGTEEQKAAYEEVVATARKNDVSVTPPSAILYHGLTLTQGEEYEEAIPFLEEALRRDPSMQAGWEGLGWAYIKTDDLPRAIRLWEYFRRLMPDQSLPYSLLAQGAILRHDWDEADKNFRKSLEIKPDQYDVRYWFAQNLLRVNSPDEAEKVLRQLIEEDPGRLDIQITLASLLTQKLQYDEAVDIYRRVNEELPDIPKFMVEEAVLELRVGELDRADELCRAVLELEPENIDAMRLRADVAEIGGQQDIEPLQKVIDDTSDPVVKASLLVRLANRCHLINEKKPDTYDTDFVLGLFKDAIELHPENVEHRLLYCERLIQADRISAAHSQALEILTKFNPNNDRAKAALFEIAVRERRFNDAENILEDRYSGFDPEDPMVHYYRARLKTARGYYADALAEIDMMEQCCTKGTLFSLLYRDLTESDWMPVTSVRRLHEHILALQNAGWILIAPTNVPSALNPKAPEVIAEDDTDSPPLTARLVDTLQWCITGKRRLPVKRRKTQTEREAQTPPRYFTVTFEDGLRSSLELGTSVALDFGVPFGYFTPTEQPAEYTPERADWEEMRQAVDSGAWVVGSQLHSANMKKPVDEDGLDVRAPLPNRIWNAERGRPESMNEWDRRMRREFRESRRMMKKELGERDASVPMVSYPYGDIGQETSCNLASLRNPAHSIIAEASRVYEVGFVQSTSGYTVPGQLLALCRRYAPGWMDEGSDVVRHAYEYHPMFLARHMRVELAMLMNKPNLALEVIAELRADGYPEDICRRLEADMNTHFRNVPARDTKTLTSVIGAPGSGEGTLVASAGAPGSGGEGGVDVEVDESKGELEDYETNPWLGLRFTHSKANDQIETMRYGISAGLSLSRNTHLSVEGNLGTLKQTVRPYWNAVAATNVPYSQKLYGFRMDTTDARVTLVRRTENGAILTAALGWMEKKSTTNRKIFRRNGRLWTYDRDGKPVPFNLQDGLNSFDYDEADHSATTFLLTLGANFHPRDTLSIAVLYDHGFVPSAVKNVTYDSVAVNTSWRPYDDWSVDTHLQYWTYEDDNAMFNGRIESLWEADEQLGIWAGFQLSTVTTSEGTDYYWSPYWDQRIMGLLRLQQRWEGFGLRLDMLGGYQREDGRSDRAFETETEEDKEILVDGVANTVTEKKTEYMVVSDPGTGWNLAWGFSGGYERKLADKTTLIIEGEIIAMREYIDHSLMISLHIGF